MEILAEASHEAWMAQKIKAGYIWGAKSTKKTHPLLVPYRELEEKDKEGNRKTARLLQSTSLSIPYQSKNVPT